jgi:hypothetical protein
MSANDVSILFLSLVALTFGILSIFRKDIIWKIYRWNMRSEGIKDIERTPEWNLRWNVNGIGMCIVSLIGIVYTLSS